MNIACQLYTSKPQLVAHFGHHFDLSWRTVSNNIGIIIDIKVRYKGKVKIDAMTRNAKIATRTDKICQFKKNLERLSINFI